MAQDALKYKAVIIGGSAGSLDAVIKIITGATTAKNIFYVVVVHRKNDSDSVLSSLLRNCTALNVKEVEDKDSVLPASVYIAPADYHLLFENERMFSLDASEKIYYSRPSINVTFESAAEVFGASAIGVLLSGANGDGAEGLKKLKEKGGYTIVQDPSTAEVDYMPKRAIEIFEPDAVKNSYDITELIRTLTD